MPQPDAADEAVNTLRSWLPTADLVEADLSNNVQFIDQGGNFERVVCPACGTELPTAAWSDAMDDAFRTDFAQLDIRMPCCGADTSLNDLRYESPAGFARFVLEARNPGIRDLPTEQRARLEDILATPLRMIWAHY